jgi:hypothetical protein
LDSVFVFVDNPIPDVQLANNVLVDQGTFQDVVNLLQDMTDNSNVFDIDLIHENRCANVLPVIDLYFAAASQALGSAVSLTAARPLACQ